MDGELHLQELSFDELYRKYDPVVRGRVFSALGDTPEVEDVVQRIFMDAFAYVTGGKFEGNSSLSTVVYTITDRRLADHFRKLKSEKKAYDGLMQEFVGKAGRPKSDASFVAQSESRLLFEKVMGLIEELPKVEKDIFIDMELLDLEAATIAERRNLSEKMVYRHHQSARDHLSKAFKVFMDDACPKMSQKDLELWVEKFYNAYFRLGDKSGHLTEGIRFEAWEAQRCFKIAIKHLFGGNGEGKY